MSSSSSHSLKEYLKRYESSSNDPNKTKKKKKKLKNKPDLLSPRAGVLVVDNDPIWQKPVPMEDVEEQDNLADETPLVEEDIEVKRMKRLETLRSLKPYHAINEDGSGWVSIPKGGDLSPRLINHETDSDKDLSPPRRRTRLDTPSPEHLLSGGDSVDLSPPRRRNLDDLSPRRKPREGMVEDFSRRSSSAVDLYLPRRSRELSPHDLSPPRRASMRSSEPADVHKDSLLKRGGILSAKEMREETDRKRKEEKSRFAAMDPLLTGRGVEAVYRDKEGKRISKEELMKSKEKKKEEKPLEWGKGLAQKREAEERGKELELEKERPFTRTRDDPELEKMLKERLRWGDPMAHLVKGKTSELILEDLSKNEKMKESGFIVPQTIPSHSWLKRGLDFPTNRYNIRPGRHWDGVDRSNGYEKELFKRQNEKRATETEAYLWSVSDM